MTKIKSLHYLKYAILTLVVVLSPIFLFQNCSQFSDPYNRNNSSTLGMTSSAEPDPNHAPQEEIAPPSKQIRLGNRRYMMEIFRDVFTSVEGVKAPGLDTLLFKWAENRGAQLGGGCDSNDSLTMADCGDDLASTALPIHSDPNTIRESFKIQLCEELIGTNEGFAIALSNAGMNPGAVLPDPNFQNMVPLYELFYRTTEAPPYFLQTMSQLSTDLKAKNETPQSVWRGLLLLVCESPEWQIL